MSARSRNRRTKSCSAEFDCISGASDTFTPGPLRLAAPNVAYILYPPLFSPNRSTGSFGIELGLVTPLRVPSESLAAVAAGSAAAHMRGGLLFDCPDRG